MLRKVKVGGIECELADIPKNDPDYTDVFVVWVDGNIAAHWLKHRARNRNVRPAHAQGFTQDVLNGRWLYESHHPVGFNTDDQMFDAQHRVSGVVGADRQEPGIRVMMKVAVNVPKKVNPITDIAKARGLDDSLRIERGITCAPMVVAIIRKVSNLLTGTGTTKVRNLADWDDWMEVFGNSLAYVQSHIPTPELRKANVAGPLVLAHYTTPGAVADILDGYNGKTATRKGDPGRELERYLARYKEMYKGHLQHGDYDRVAKAVSWCIMKQERGHKVANIHLYPKGPEAKMAPDGLELYVGRARVDDLVQVLIDPWMSKRLSKPELARLKKAKQGSS